PVPSKGTESMLHFMKLVGSQIQPECDYRPDVLSFVSDEIKEPMTIAGSIKVHLWVTSDCEDTAFTAKVMEILPDGRAVNIRSSITSIAADNPDLNYVPGEPVSVTVDMWDIAWELHAGGRLRIDISSSDFPQYSVHTNYKGVWALQDKARTAHQTILCGGDHPSWVEIPVKNL
ncbi:MAG: CocE/NonD family hydrolase, partial [Parasporobacterium sp.]|nr:CocE/NonD family hydrolase [Parasporobacterium sp.]